MSQLHVKISWLYFFGAYIGILQMSSKDSKWWANIHGAEEHEAWGNWEGGSLLWKDSEVGSWFNHGDWEYQEDFDTEVEDEDCVTNKPHI